MISDMIPRMVFNSSVLDKFWEKQCQSIIVDLQNFVDEHNMTVEEVHEYNLSDIGHGNVTFYSYTDYMEEHNGRPTNAKVICSNGVFYPKEYVPSSNYWDHWNYVGVGIAFVFSELVILSFVYNLLQRMKTLYNQVISTDLNKRDLVIGVEGKDELSLLSEKVETMRRMLIKSIDDEMKQREQQTKLIASLSHDIRTPLTKIITCLDILNYNLVKSEEERQNCVKMITSKANQLKCLTDRLLNPVSHGTKYSVEQQEIFDGPSMLSQFLFEGSYYLEQEGFEVFLPKTISGTYRLRVDIVALRRVVDNIYSNVQKYGDKKNPVKIWIEENDQFVIVHVQNYKKTESTQRKEDSYGIGLVTITQIMEEMGGRSEVENKNQVFTIKLTLPKYDYPVEPD